MALRIAVLANLKANAPRTKGDPVDRWSELDSSKTVEAIISALESAGHEAVFLEGNTSLYRKLQIGNFDMAFNICEGHRGDARESQVPAILEMLGIPYAGSKILSLALTLDKPMAKRILVFHGLPTPPFQVFESEEEAIDCTLRYPLFVKPSQEGTGMGISGDSIVHDETELRARVRWIIDTYREPALVEKFVGGREVTVGILGNESLHIFPPLEVDLSPCPAEENGIYTSRIKSEFYDLPRYVCPAPLKEAQVEELGRLAAATYRALNCLDFARVDFRLDAHDNERPYILEVNPLPGLCPGVSDYVMLAEADGMTHAQLINAIVNEALKRYPELAHKAYAIASPEMVQVERG